MASLAAIQADLQALLVPSIPVLLGDEELAAQGAPPRIVLVPRADGFSAPRQDTASTQRSLATRNATIEAHLWATDLDAAEDMLNAFVAATRRSVSVNYTLVAGGWKGQSVNSAGRTYVLTFTVAIPVVEPAIQTATVTAIPQTTEVDHG